MEANQKINTRRWRSAHKHRARMLSYRSTARTFIRKYASEKDLNSLQDMINRYRPIAKKRSLKLS